jgi:hypothetical protein
MNLYCPIRARSSQSCPRTSQGRGTVTQPGTWVSLSGTEPLERAIVLLVIAGVMAFLATRLRHPVAAARPERAVAAFMILTWLLSMATFLIGVGVDAIRRSWPSSRRSRSSCAAMSLPTVPDERRRDGLRIVTARSRGRASPSPAHRQEDLDPAHRRFPAEHRIVAPPVMALALSPLPCPAIRPCCLLRPDQAAAGEIGCRKVSADTHFESRVEGPARAARARRATPRPGRASARPRCLRTIDQLIGRSRRPSSTSGSSSDRRRCRPRQTSG